MLMNKFCNFCGVFSYFGVKNRYFSTHLISMLRMQEMVLAGFKFQKFSGGPCHQTPLGGAWPSATHVHFIQNDAESVPDIALGPWQL
jgi:hypothetical protein